MKPAITIGALKNYKRRRLRQQNNVSYKNEDNKLTGNWSQTNIPLRVRKRMLHRRDMLKQAYHDSQVAKYILLLYISICLTYAESTAMELSFVLHLQSL